MRGACAEPAQDGGETVLLDQRGDASGGGGVGAAGAGGVVAVADVIVIEGSGRGLGAMLEISDEAFAEPGGKAGLGLRFEEDVQELVADG